MEGLIQLVAASFARHGIECPADGSLPAPTDPAEPAPTAKLPEHNYRKTSPAEPAAP